MGEGVVGGIVGLLSKLGNQLFVFLGVRGRELFLWWMKTKRFFVLLGKVAVVRDLIPAM